MQKKRTIYGPKTRLKFSFFLFFQRLLGKPALLQTEIRFKKNAEKMFSMQISATNQPSPSVNRNIKAKHFLLCQKSAIFDKFFN